MVRILENGAVIRLAQNNKMHENANDMALSLPVKYMNVNDIQSTCDWMLNAWSNFCAASEFIAKHITTSKALHSYDIRNGAYLHLHDAGTQLPATSVPLATFIDDVVEDVYLDLKRVLIAKPSAYEDVEQVQKQFDQFCKTFMKTPHLSQGRAALSSEGFSMHFAM